MSSAPGRLQRHAAAFSSEQAVRWVVECIVAPLGRRIDDSSPMVDARLPDGSRVNAVIAPIAIRGVSLTIRKFPRQRPGMADLLAAGSLSEPMARFLLQCVHARKNLLVSGGTGSGKTTLLNILSNAIPEGERIVTIEDAAELRLDHAHLVALEARPANAEGRGRVDIRDLVRNALRMRPDRIVVGECRGAEAFDMLTAMNTGHEGSLTTLHANTPRDALARLEAVTLMAELDLPLPVVREHIAASIDIIVQQARMADGRRIVTAIVEIAGMESGRIQTQELFRYDARHGFIAGDAPVLAGWRMGARPVHGAAGAGAMIWLAMGMAMAAAAWLAWRVLAWSGPAARRYRAVYTQQAGAHLSEVFLFVDPAQLWAAALAMAAAGGAGAWVFSGSAWLAAVAAVALLRLPHLLLGAAATPPAPARAAAAGGIGGHGVRLARRRRHCRGVAPAGGAWRGAVGPGVRAAVARAAHGRVVRRGARAPGAPRLVRVDGAGCGGLARGGPHRRQSGRDPGRHCPDGYRPGCSCRIACAPCAPRDACRPGSSAPCRPS
ncbi:secretory protein [Bordetella pertussis]|nr:secretory protein [Bordetella pertussis]